MWKHSESNNIALQAQGIHNIEDLAMLAEGNIRYMGKQIYGEGQVDFPIIATQKQIIVYYWRRKLASAGQTVDVVQINTAMLTREAEAF